jgi:shikimate kinase
VRADAHIALIGLRCAGKSTIGPLLARELGRSFVDLDDVTASELGFARAGEALAQLGEPAFRAGELHALVKTLASGTPQVLALGGGTPTHEPSLEILLDQRNAGALAQVYLHAAPDVLATRMRAGGSLTRPALLGHDASAEVAELYRRRDGLYRQIAHRTIEAGELAPDTAATVIASWLRAQTR